MKKLIIHMVNGEKYEVFTEEYRDEDVFNAVKNKFYNFIEARIKFITFHEKIHIDRDASIKIKYVSRFAIYYVKSATIQVNNISSIDLVEVD